MRNCIKISLLFFVFTAQAQKTSFSETALQDVFISENDTEIPFSEVLKKYKGKTVFIDIWASWCRDCIQGMPKVKELQHEYKDVVFVFLSLDENTEKWKKGIAALHLEGEHYFIASGWKGAFCSSIELDWIPRYMIINPAGEIRLYKAITADNENIKKSLK